MRSAVYATSHVNEAAFASVVDESNTTATATGPFGLIGIAPRYTANYRGRPFARAANLPIPASAAAAPATRHT